MWIDFTMKGFLCEPAYSSVFLSGCFWHFGQDCPLFGPHPLNGGSGPHVGTT